MKIYLIRHAQSQWQVAPSHDWDTALSRTGHEQAQRLGHWLADRPCLAEGSHLQVAGLCSSPLVRARETAAYVADALGLPLDTDDRLCEATFHVSSHLPQRETPFTPSSPYEPSALYRTFKSQAREALDGLVERAAGTGSVMAITHGALIETMLRSVVGNDAMSFSLYNSAVTLVEWTRGRWHLVLLNCWDHLPVDLRTS